MRGAPFPPEEYLRRTTAVERKLRDAGLDALVAYSAGHQPGPVGYLAGYEPSFGLHDVAFFVLAGSPARRTVLANAFWDLPETRACADEVLVTSDFASMLAQRLPSSVRRLGIAGLSFFPAPVYAALRTAFPHLEIEDATRLVKEVACVKSPGEVEVMRRSARMTEAGGRAFLDGVEAGADERELQWAVERAMLAAGADRLAFPTLLFSGDAVPRGIGFAADRRLLAGEQVNLVCGASHSGYRTEVGRIACVGPPADPVLGIMETAAEMHAAMLDASRPGVAVRDVAGEAVRVAARAGLDGYLYRSANAGPGYGGHGMGCWYSELPDINTAETAVLEPGMVLILEARLGVPGVGGATITDPVLVTPAGAERLVTLDTRTWRT